MSDGKNDIDKRIEALLKSLEELRESQKETKEMIKSISEQQKKTDEQQKKTDEMIKSISEQQKKTDEQQNKTDEQMKRTDEQMKRTDEQIKRTDEQIKRTDEQIKRTDEELRAMFKKADEEFEKLRKSVAGISDGWGRLSEGFAIASVEKIFKGIGIFIKETYARARSRMNGKELEIDLISVGKMNGKEIAIAIEVKTYMKKEDIDDFLNKDISNFFKFFSKYRGMDLIGGIAFMNSTKEVKTYAEKNGLYLFSLGEDVMTLANSKGFKPKIW